MFIPRATQYTQLSLYAPPSQLESTDQKVRLQCCGSPIIVPQNKHPIANLDSHVCNGTFPLLVWSPTTRLQLYVSNFVSPTLCLELYVSNSTSRLYGSNFTSPSLCIKFSTSCPFSCISDAPNGLLQPRHNIHMRSRQTYIITLRTIAPHHWPTFPNYKLVSLTPDFQFRPTLSTLPSNSTI